MREAGKQGGKMSELMFRWEHSLQEQKLHDMKITGSPIMLKVQPVYSITVGFSPVLLYC